MQKNGSVIKLALIYVVIAVSVFLLLNTFGMASLRKKLVTEKRSYLGDVAALISDEYVTPYYNDVTKLSDMKRQMRSVATFLNIRVCIVNAKGYVIVDTAGTFEKNSIDDKAEGFLDELISNGYVENYYIDEEYGKVIANVEPINKDYTLRGYVIAMTKMTDIKASTNNYLDFINIAYIWFTAILLGAFIILYYIGPYQAAKINKIAMEYSKGHFDEKIELNTHDEYSALAATVNYMGEEMKNLNDYQKKFIANVSHDFKSPLTSIKGYTEAMKDGVIPPEEQGKYLEIIAFETERLTKLTSNLLSLSGFENGGTKLELSVFDINAMIKKTAMTFEGTCTKKKVTLNLTFEADKENVQADFGRIQQVLYNLIDNAVKFSNEFSVVDISTKVRGSKVLISVKDHGIGIPADSLGKIWERFYKTDVSRGKDKKGTGLGLAITKDIVEAHHENINVVSTLGVGTEFTFTLPLAETP
ncbi:MAG: HAMP domain-containing histidine kinase [Lachnospiraceae bacterium]|nr:HAMP domain-containing histidine kinase [Lachnospiraceae bacterium]